MNLRRALILFAAITIAIPAAQADEFEPRQKDCVGYPPRQIEDPLGPPCVPFYEGSPPASYPGVTPDEIRLVLYNDLGLDGELNGPWHPSDEERLDPSRANLVRTLKAHLRYFQRRMQTYNRTVRVFAVSSRGESCSERSADARSALADFDPLGALLLASDTSCFVREIASEGRFSFSFRPLDAATLGDSEPFAYSFMPEPELQAQSSAGFLCRSLAGGRASFAQDLTLRNIPRRLGLLVPRRRGEGHTWGIDLSEEFRRQCNGTFDARARIDMSSRIRRASDSVGALIRFKSREITTVVCACPALPDSDTIPVLQGIATALSYQPEWYFDSTSGMDVAVWHRRNQIPGQSSFGASSLWRQPALREQYHYQAYLQEEPGTTPNSLHSFESYHLFLMVFTALQSAGPEPDDVTIPQAMNTWNWTDPTNPFVPIGGFGAHGPQAVGPFSFVDAGMAWWWDPSGTGPGGDAGEGCVRVSREGRRFHMDEWPAGDSHLFKPSDPCSGPTVEDSVTPF